jgi:hypothetical protein
MVKNGKAEKSELFKAFLMPVRAWIKVGGRDGWNNKED